MALSCALNAKDLAYHSPSTIAVASDTKAAACNLPLPPPIALINSMMAITNGNKAAVKATKWNMGTKRRWFFKFCSAMSFSFG
jgi:hypothetical protein